MIRRFEQTFLSKVKNNHRKDAQHHLFIREIPIENTVIYYVTVIIIGINRTSVGEDVWKLEFLYTVKTL